jgi:hypothetical protein
VLGRHQDEVRKISWDIVVDGQVRNPCWHRLYYTNGSGRRRFVLHECFFPGQVVGINCVVPSVITDDDLWQLMQIVGRYRGISPWLHGEYGLFEVESVRPRRISLGEVQGLIPKDRVQQSQTEEVRPSVMT